MKFNSTVNNLSSGEWSPKMIARTDVQQFKNAAKQLKNFIPVPQGGAFRRPGTMNITFSSGTYVTKLEGFDSVNKPPQMIPVKLSDGTKRILFTAVASTPSSDWFTSNGINTGYAISVDTSDSINAFKADFQVNMEQCWSQVGDIVVMTDVLGTKIPRIWLNVDAAGGSYYTLKRYVEVYQKSTEYWKFTPYLPLNANGSNVTMTASAATGAITITASAAYFDSAYTWAGTFIKLSSAGSTGVAVITSRTSDTVVNATVLSTVPTVACGAAAGTSWEESAWSARRGWPKYVVPHEGRLYYGGTTTQPDTVWASRIGNYFDMMERPFEQEDYYDTYIDDNSRPFSFSPNSQGTTNITGLSAGKKLVVHMDQGELVASGQQMALGPLDISIESSSSYGKYPFANTIRSDNYLLVPNRRDLRDIVFDLEQGQFKASSVSFLADHLTSNITQTQIDEDVAISYQDFFKTLVRAKVCGANGVFSRTLNGRLVWLTLDREYNIVAWAPMELGGTSEIGFTRILDLCQLDGAAYFIVSRTINGVEKTQLEWLTSFTDNLMLWSEGVFPLSTTAPSTPIPGFYVDAAGTYNSTATTTISGLTYLAGASVDVIADGIYVGRKTVSNAGVLTLSTAASKVIFGRPYTSRIETMPFELGQQVPDSPNGFTKRIDELNIRFYHSYGAKYGVDVDDLLPINFVDPEAVINDPPVMFTGIKTMKVPQRYSRECTVIIEQDKPWPCNILSVTATGALYG